jgi:dTDP-4-dehydrorhamnose 3,5-epimerase
MKLIREALPGLKLLEPTVFQDERGYFFESYNHSAFRALGIEEKFLQDNQSLSTQRGVLRGLHFQAPPHAQSKLVRVIQGAVLDVVVDIRTSSETFGQHASFRLDSVGKQLLYIPEGFAHGFLTLEENTLFSYKCGDMYNKASEVSIQWNDPDLDIDWGIDEPILSEKDRIGVSFKDFVSPF